ncbi:MAG TPA: arsenate reductase family protein [Leptospiraceae bacterium]|nr:arsenate reductase family protein [Leptospirales bacterium]HMU83606.1 arsenate reductase family protein [Leptospiraceae bacterium]HMX55797.1 arsenate reductase family protein [Leptospiraceae bacterium]HMY47511.1 arsenate reductase family protein [Leptospiraceae bacterium]HNE23337.1 arsenate reductase family protein [Leptospiraceae bacterium]
MNIQIFGLKSCPNTRKAEMFFKERRITYQFINLAEKPMSRGELTSVMASIPAEELIDTESRAYVSAGLQYMKFNIAEKLLEEPRLFKTPIVRDAKRATAGFAPEIWKKWLS